MFWDTLIHHSIKAEKVSQSLELPGCNLFDETGILLRRLNRHGQDLQRWRC
jgi:hypothetical protein